MFSFCVNTWLIVNSYFYVLQGIANDPDNTYLYYVEQFDKLVTQVDTLIKVACQVASG